MNAPRVPGGEGGVAFCPECGREYSSQVVACRDCRILLSDEPPATQAPVQVTWTRLCAISGLVEGSMLKGALEMLKLGNPGLKGRLKEGERVLLPWNLSERWE